MTDQQRGNPDFLNGVPELLVLKLLSGEEMHGYRIVKEIKSRSGDKLEISDGCIYPLLHELEDQGYLDSRMEEVQGRERYYYRLTENGETRLESLLDEWRDVVEGIMELFEDDEGVPALV